MPKCINMLAVLCVVAALSSAALAQEKADQTKRPSLAGSQWAGDLTLSWQDLGESGSAQRLFKYDRPPDGLFVGELGVTGVTSEGFGLLNLSAFEIGEEDEGVSLQLRSPNCPTSLRWDVSRYQFFADPITTAAVGSKRNDNDLILKLALDGPVPSATIRYHRQQYTAPTIARLGTAGLGWDAKEFSIETALPMGPGVLGLSFGQAKFDDRTGAQANRETDTVNVNYDLDLGSRLNVTALYSRANIDQGLGLPGADIENAEIRGRYIGNRYNLGGTLGSQWVNQTGTVNGYTRQTNTADVRAGYRLSPKIALNAGYNRLDFERIDRAHTVVATPRRNTSWVKLRTKLPYDLRLSAKYKKQDLDDTPLSGIPGSATTNPLYRDDVERMDVRVSGPVLGVAQGYAFYTNDDIKNTARALNYVSETYGGGLFSQLSPKLSVTVDALKQNYEGLTNTADAVGMALNGGLPLTADAEIVTVTADYQVNDATSLSGFYTKYRGQEGALINDRDFGVALRRALKSGLSCGVEWRQYTHDDNDPWLTPAGGLDFDTDVIRVDLTAKF